MDFYDDLTELEIIELEELKNNLLNKLESGCSLLDEDEILEELNNIQSQLDNLY